MMWRRPTALCVALAVAATVHTAVYADDFYRGKQITIVVGFSAGGTYDATARLFARFLGKHLAGNPTIIVRNMPGAGSLVATMNLFNTAPRDGTTLGIIGGGTVLEPLLGNPQAQYDARQFAWIGGRSRDDFLCVVWHTVPVSSIADVMQRETAVGATGPGSRTLTYPKALNDLVGTKFKIVAGYPGGNEITLGAGKGRGRGLLRLGHRQHPAAHAAMAARWHAQGLGSVHFGKARSCQCAGRQHIAENARGPSGHRYIVCRFRSGVAINGAARVTRRTDRRLAHRL
jgi:hypothetical protein